MNNQLVCRAGFGRPVPPLSASLIRVDCGPDRPLKDFSGLFRPSQVQVYFRNLEAHLVGHIRQARLVAGCVAWLTSEPILDALAGVPGGVSLVVQKEDFLRPDVAANKGFSTRLRTMYRRLAYPPERCWANWPTFGGMSACGDPGVDPVRCVGNHNRDRLPAFPRMHNKFLVFCDVWKECGCRMVSDGAPDCPGCDDCCKYPRIMPYAVWTGSFNLTKNADLSFENAVYIPDPATAQAYFEEFGQIMALSEPLDWSSDWMAPEWRVGT